jgi:hypothetical protein
MHVAADDRLPFMADQRGDRGLALAEVRGEAGGRVPQRFDALSRTVPTGRHTLQPIRQGFFRFSLPCARVRAGGTKQDGRREMSRQRGFCVFEVPFNVCARGGTWFQGMSHRVFAFLPSPGRRPTNAASDEDVSGALDGGELCLSAPRGEEPEPTWC